MMIGWDWERQYRPPRLDMNSLLPTVPQPPPPEPTPQPVITPTSFSPPEMWPKGMFRTNPAPGGTGVVFPSGMPLGGFTDPIQKQAAANVQAAAAAGNTWDARLKKLMENKDFPAALEALASGIGIGKKKGPEVSSSPFKVSPSGHVSKPKDISGPASKLLQAAGLVDLLGEGSELTDLKGRSKRRRQQSRYDILARDMS
jgi:hypothetical protein